MNWKTCQRHGPDDGKGWACPDCYLELRSENYRLKYFADRMLSLMTTCQLLERKVDHAGNVSFHPTAWFTTFQGRLKTPPLEPIDETDEDPLCLWKNPLRHRPRGVEND